MKRLLMLAAMMMMSAALFAQPINDLCVNDYYLTVDAPCIPGTTINASVEDPSIDPGIYPADVWYSFTATSGQTVIYVYPDANVDPDIIVFDNCGGTILETASAGLTAGAIDSLNFATTIGTTYYISVVGYQNDPSGDFCISVSNTTAPQPPYDPCVDFVDVTVTDPCYTDNVNQDTLMKSYRFTAISENTKLILTIDEPFYLPAVYISETNCDGAVIHDWTDAGTINGNVFTVIFSTTIGSQYAFFLLHTDPTFNYQFPMDYCVDLDVTLGQSEIEQNQIAIYPNPAQDNFMFTSKSESGTIEIIDITGRLMYANEITSVSTPIDISTFVSGVYTVRYTNGLDAQSIKLIKQ